MAKVDPTLPSSVEEPFDINSQFPDEDSQVFDRKREAEAEEDEPGSPRKRKMVVDERAAEEEVEGDEPSKRKITEDAEEEVSKEETGDKPQETKDEPKLPNHVLLQENVPKDCIAVIFNVNDSNHWAKDPYKQFRFVVFVNKTTRLAKRLAQQPSEKSTGLRFFNGSQTPVEIFSFGIELLGTEASDIPNLPKNNSDESCLDDVSKTIKAYNTCTEYLIKVNFQEPLDVDRLFARAGHVGVFNADGEMILKNDQDVPDETDETADWDGQSLETIFTRFLSRMYTFGGILNPSLALEFEGVEFESVAGCVSVSRRYSINKSFVS
jgi:hypothetical protein